MGKKGKGILRLALFFSILSLSACTPVSGDRLPEGVEALLVGDILTQQVRFFDLEKQKITGILQIKGYRFTGYKLFDRNHLLFYSSTENRLLVYDLVKGNVTKEILVQHPIQDIIKITRNHFLLLLQDGRTVYELLLPDGSLKERIQLPESARKIALSTDMKDLYYFHKGEENFSKISLKSGEKLYTSRLVQNASDGWENPETREFWVGGHGTAERLQTSICRYDARTGKYIGRLAGGTMPIHFYVDQAEEAVYVISHGSNIVQKYLFSGKLDGEADTGLNPFGMDGNRRHLFIANYDSQTVTIYTKNPLKKTGEYPIGDDPLLIQYRGRDDLNE